MKPDTTEHCAVIAKAYRTIYKKKSRLITYTILQVDNIESIELYKMRYIIGPAMKEVVVLKYSHRQQHY